MPDWPIFRLAVLSILAWLFLGGTFASAKPNGSRLTLHDLRIDARAFRSFAKSGDKGNRFGRLRFRGGLVLRSSDAAFGGFSGLEVSPDGRGLVAVSDAGAWLKAKIRYRGDRPVGLGGAKIGPILALGARRLRRGRDRDAEAIRLYKGDLSSGTVLIGFEVNERVGFFDLVNGHIKSPKRYLRPPARLVYNKGIEATGVIRKGPYKGAVVAFAERSLDRKKQHRGWMWHRHGTKKKGPEKIFPLALTNIGNFDITDVTGAMDGGLYVLERRFRWSEGIFMRIRHIPAAAIKPGAVLSGNILITADLGYEIDNMEGIAAHVDKRGRTVLTLISDNNFNSFLQRTVLLQFEVGKK